MAVGRYSLTDQKAESRQEGEGRQKQNRQETEKTEYRE